MKNNDVKIKPTLRYGDDAPAKRVKGVRKYTYSEFMAGMKRFLYSACICVFVFVLSYYVLNYVFQHVIVDGTSMNDTLNNGDHLVVDRISYKFKEPSKSDIIVFRPYKDDPECFYIKRVIGVPGDSVLIHDGFVYVNGLKLDEDYCKEELTLNPGIAVETLTLGDNDYFVMGDNRQVSLDSRSPEVGLISNDQIVGRCMVDFWPLNHFDFFINE